MNSLIVLGFILLIVLLIGGIFLAFWFYKLSQTAQPQNNTAMTLLQQQLDSLRTQVSESLNQTNQLLNQQLSNVSSQIQQQMNSVSQNMQTSAGQIYTRLDNYSQVVQNVDRQLGSLSEATKKIFEATKNIAALEDILKPPKLRGSMGEILLENILREILPAEKFYSLQYQFKNKETVDAIIRLKEGLIPIDAKFPLDNFRRMMETDDEKERAQLRKEFVKNLKKHVDDISRKYILTDEGTFNFALMYIPAENIYYEMIIRGESPNEGVDLYSYATQKHIFPVSPNSLYPYLMTLSLGFRGLKIEQQAREILNELYRLHGDLERFSADFETVGKHLFDAQKKFTEAEKKLNKVENKLLFLKEGTATPLSSTADAPIDSENKIS